MHNIGCLSKDEMMRYLRKELTPQQVTNADAHLAACEFCREAFDGMKDFLCHKTPETLESVLTELDREVKIKIENKVTDYHKNRRAPGHKIFYWILPVVSIIIISCIYFLFFRKDQTKTIIKESPQVIILQSPGKDTLTPPPSLAKQEKMKNVRLETKVISQDITRDNRENKIDKLLNKTPENRETEINPSSAKENVIVLENPAPRETNNTIGKSEIFTVVEEQPQYPGGEKAQLKFLNENIIYPKEARDLGIQGKVYLTFVVETDGTISDTRILRGIGGGCDEEAIRVIKAMPKWIPGKQRGVPVRVQFSIPVKFVL
jgi:TonB family protein